jgi:NADP-dependent 3-hydroxy acid dehydrogenase YdfG
MSKPVSIVVGVGPGIGAAVARRFGEAGYDVGLVARSAARLEAFGTELQQAGVTAGWAPVDITDVDSFAAAVTRLADHTGRVDHLHFNPSATRMDDPLELSVPDLLADVHLGVASLLTAVQAARPYMREGARITATGSISADQPWAAAASLGVQKAGLRNLVLALDARLEGDGIRAVMLTVNGLLAEGTEFDPARIADAIHLAAQQPADAWRAEIPYP